MDDEILSFNLTAMVFGIVALTIGYLYALPKVESGAVPFAMIIELGDRE